jgi:hypothetical protein
MKHLGMVFQGRILNLSVIQEDDESCDGEGITNITT